MASQITHIVLAEKILENLFDKFDQKAFFIGTVFPDIRYLKVIERTKTHFKNLSLQDVLNEKDSFVAGMKYHSLVDEVREKYIVEKGIYSLIPSSIYITQALKVYEDEILYLNISNWEQVIMYLNEVLKQETELVEKVDRIEKWHVLMQEYFKQHPSNLSRENFILGVGFSEEIAFEINHLVAQMRQIPKVKEIILELYKNWNLLIKAD